MICEMKNNTVCKRQRKLKWQSRIDNLEAWVHKTQEEAKQNIKHNTEN
jgi:hypothetical protein